VRAPLPRGYRNSLTIVDQPIKAGWRDDDLYLEVHHPLSEEGEEDFIEPDLNDVLRVLSPLIEPHVEVDADQVDAALRLGDGVPVAVAHRASDDAMLHR